MLMFAEQSALRVADPEGEYVAVELRLFPREADGVPAELTLTGVNRSFQRTFVPLDADALAPLAGNPRAYGETLGRQLFQGTELGSQLAEVRTALDARGARWRLRLRLEDPALEALRWERLCQPENGGWAPVGASADRPFSRFVPVTDWKVAAPVMDRPIPVLLVYASPANAAAIRLAPIPPAERDVVRAAIVDGAKGSVLVQELGSDGARRPTLAALREALTRAPVIVHVLCHGVSGPAGVALVLEGDDGNAKTVDAATLVDAMRGAAVPPRLVVLQACQSAAAGAADAFVSLGGRLARDATDATLAMSEAVSMTTAGAFCAHFYERLFAHGVVDRAVNEARAAVRDALDWGAPVLYARLRDCQLLDFAPARVDAAYLGISGRAVRAATAARHVAEAQGAGQAVIEACNALIEELEKSHKVLTGVAGGFRRTGADPATFPGLFEAFRYEFKEYYDNQSWQSERTHCHEVTVRALPARALFATLLSEEDARQLNQDLDRLGSIDDDIVIYLAGFLEAMNGEVDAITQCLRKGDVAGAVARKLAFEDQISPTFRRSKELLAEIAERRHAVQAA